MQATPSPRLSSAASPRTLARMWHVVSVTASCDIRIARQPIHLAMKELKDSLPMLQTAFYAGMAMHRALLHSLSHCFFAGPSASPAAGDASAERPAPAPVPSQAPRAGMADAGQRAVDPRQRAADPRLAATQALQAQVCGIALLPL